MARLEYKQRPEYKQIWPIQTGSENLLKICLYSFFFIKCVPHIFSSYYDLYTSCEGVQPPTPKLDSMPVHFKP